MTTVYALSTYDTVLLSIIAFALTLFFVLASILVVSLLVLTNRFKRVATKAENAIDSVEAASEAIKNISAEASGPFAAFKLFRGIFDTVNRKK